MTTGRGEALRLFEISERLIFKYDWEKDRYGNFFDKQKMWTEEPKKFDVYDKEYERLKSILLTQLGSPTSTDTKAKEENSDGQRYFTRETLWESEGVYAKLNMIFAAATYRIRFTLYWKK